MARRGGLSGYETPQYYLEHSAVWLTGKRVGVYSLISMVLVLQTLSFFRLKQHSLSLREIWSSIRHGHQIQQDVNFRHQAFSALGVGLVVMSCYIFLVNFLGFRAPIAMAIASFGLSVGLFYGQFVALRSGFFELKRLKDNAMQRGDIRAFDAISQRQRLAIVYAVAIGSLCLFYGIGLPLRSLSVGSDIWLSASLLPTMALVGVIFVGVLQAQRVADMFQSQIKMMHYYWSKLGQGALLRTYSGVIIVTDLAGMGACSTLLRSLGPIGSRMLNDFVNIVRADMLALATEDFVLFNDKSNGDQDIILLNAENTEIASAIIRRSAYCLCVRFPMIP